MKYSPIIVVNLLLLTVANFVVAPCKVDMKLTACDKGPCGQNAYCDFNGVSYECLCEDGHDGDPHNIRIGCTPNSE
ncbi:unnamed protein product [Didymodactylos carnosus]|uniref:EGF-like domain-containing protein n=1 Tax=Didymodactylos carnosus TaxID=1234261 RepID=A0A815EQQ4_9BILA|nr:unnamed protein product [Didymodactylos carnosus]CAF4156713.1 unnamed protein product [Didymodactylos carnosus]